jgi:hypothetical protein
MRKIAILILLLVLSGCAFVFQNFNEQGYKNLNNGMSKAEVKSAIGSPQKQGTATIAGKEYEVWEYWEAEPPNAKFDRVGTIYYKIFFLDGKLARCDKDKVYAQPEFEYLESPTPEEKAAIGKTPEPELNLK